MADLPRFLPRQFTDSLSLSSALQRRSAQRPLSEPKHSLSPHRQNGHGRAGKRTRASFPILSLFSLPPPPNLPFSVTPPTPSPFLSLLLLPPFRLLLPLPPFVSSFSSTFFSSSLFFSLQHSTPLFSSPLLLPLSLLPSLLFIFALSPSFPSFPCFSPFPSILLRPFPFLLSFLPYISLLLPSLLFPSSILPLASHFLPSLPFSLHPPIISSSSSSSSFSPFSPFSFFLLPLIPFLRFREISSLSFPVSPSLSRCVRLSLLLTCLSSLLSSPPFPIHFLPPLSSPLSPFPSDALFLLTIPPLSPLSSPSFFLSRSESMASVCSAGAEGRYGTVVVKGEIELGLQYNYKEGQLEVRVVQCRDLAAVDTKRNRSDQNNFAYRSGSFIHQRDGCCFIFMP
ncbi:hypothetical protein C7M84_016082 [Penaeus vannamei]|uniref:Uncharacterized protein n=1 Tax=Penaeus vannamei TaxID=6689 RepID=A0A423SNX4_PENVA|nr:hypothetical protein C7M84_016082 [Penaeus vannamei]